MSIVNCILVALIRFVFCLNRYIDILTITAVEALGYHLGRLPPLDDFVRVHLVIFRERRMLSLFHLRQITIE